MSPLVPLVRYQSALLLRSQRWLAPVLLYAALLGIGVQQGQPVLDSMGYAAAGLLPVAAWLVRICVTQEPEAARACAAATAGPARVHLASLLSAMGCAALLGVVGTAYVAAVSDPASGDHQVAVPLGAACAAGLIAAGVCALTGAAVGTLGSRPVLRARGWSLALTALAALLALVLAPSPARYAVFDLVTGSRTGAVHLALVPLGAALALAGTAAAGACALSARRR
ncbi:MULTISPECIES: ABC transporter [unclassified Streptomyces]|uniref:ABC transporter n=1 Tax=unclassified Streptomyces TaxID=2593676 RepID=UPI000C280960|nr:ABC transporter [Streptomyces sp. CB01201]MBX7470443.1 ABC transporter [Streptomyces sp. MAG02]PJN02141.1 ABC transporter [Streptomyces sp. CB01201]